MIVVYCAYYRLYSVCYRMAVGLFRGLGCERSELPCLVCDGDI